MAYLAAGSIGAEHVKDLCLLLQEFRRLDSSLGAARDRAELLGGGSETLPLLSVQVKAPFGQAMCIMVIGE